MKKISVLLLMFLLLCGCNNKKEKTDPIDLDAVKKELNNKLIEYGKLIYENDTWIYGDNEPGVYLMNLKEMSERNGYDISMFVNPETKETCNIEKTRIEFYIKGKTGDKNDYYFVPVLDCGF